MAENIVLKIDVQNANSVGEASKQVGNIKKELKDLTKLLTSGQLTAEQFDTISKRAGELKDQIGDVNQQVKNLSSDSKTLDGYVGIATGITAGFSAVQGAMALFGDESEDVQKALLKVQGATAMLSGFVEIQNALQKQSNFMMGIADLKAKGLALSTKLYAWATNLAAQSTNALKVAMLGLATAGIGVVLYLLSKYSEEMESNIEIEKEKMKTLNELNEELIKNNAQSNIQVAKLKEYQTILNDNNVSLAQKETIYKELKKSIPALTNFTLEQAKAEGVLTKAIESEVALIELRGKAKALESYVVAEEEKKLKKESSDRAIANFKEIEKIGKLKADGHIVEEKFQKKVEKTLTASEQLAKVNEAILDLQTKQNAIEEKGTKLKEQKVDSKKDQAEALKKEQELLANQKKAQEEYDAEKLKKQEALIELIKELSTKQALNNMSERDKEIQELNDSYTAKMELAKGNAELEKELLAQKTFEITQITDKYNKEQADKDKETKDEALKRQKEYNQAVEEAEQSLLDAKRGALESGFDIAQQFTGKNKTLADTLFAIQKGVAIAQIIIDTQKEISGYASNPLWTAMPDGGASLKIPAIASAKIRAVTSIATIGATTIGKFMNGGGGGSGGGGGNNSGGSSAPSLRAFQTNLPEQQGGGSSNAMKVYVTETDIRKTTNKTNSIYSQALVD